MVRTLLVRGMLVGVLAAILSFAFLKLAGEPAVEHRRGIPRAEAGARACAGGRHARNSLRLRVCRVRRRIDQAVTSV